ncbi:MAG: RNA polymerase sigma-70 factor (ECF subfamily) [Chlamydiales bacterium]|jgi:RNA polymerase sigma-70 factor (ECF subfamily)
MTDQDEAELLERFQAGVADAFAELVRIHQGPLLRYARGLLGAGSAYEDVVQEAFLKLAQSPPKLSVGGEKLASWLFKVARNLCMDVMRSETTRKKREESVATHEATAGGIAAVEAEDTRGAIEAKLSGLPVDQRDVLVLRLLGDKSYKEIAAITGKKIGTVGWLVSEGLKVLSTELAPLFTGHATGTGRSAANAQGETS